MTELNERADSLTTDSEFRLIYGLENTEILARFTLPGDPILLLDFKGKILVHTLAFSAQSYCQIWLQIAVPR